MSGFVQSGRFAAPASTFDPFDIGWHAAVWADDPNWSNPGNGNVVDQWDDGSGNARHLTGSGAARPIFRSSVAALNNRAGVDFDGVDDFLTSAAFTSISNPSVVWIGVRDGAGGGVYERAVDLHLGASPYQSLFMRTGTGKWSIYSGGFVDSTVSYANGAAYAIRVRFASGSSSRININGTSISITTSTDTATRLSLAKGEGGGDWGNHHTGFAGVFEGDVTGDANWSGFVSWVSSHYGLTIA